MATKRHGKSRRQGLPVKVTRTTLQRSGRARLTDIRDLIEESREQVSRTVNSAIVWLYWNIGERIRQDVLKEKRAGYGEEILQTLSARLTAEYGRGFDHRNLSYMVRSNMWSFSNWRRAGSALPLT